jgi:hypothetical protein
MRRALERSYAGVPFMPPSRRPQRRQRDKAELVAERHDLVAQAEHHSDTEQLAELVSQCLEHGKVRRPHCDAGLDRNVRDWAVGLFYSHIHLQADGGPEVVECRSLIGPGNLFAEFAYHMTFQQPSQ